MSLWSMILTHTRRLNKVGICELAADSFPRFEIDPAVKKINERGMRRAAVLSAMEFGKAFVQINFFERCRAIHFDNEGVIGDHLLYRVDVVGKDPVFACEAYP